MGIDLSKLLEEQDTYTTGKKPEMKRELNKMIRSVKKILSELEDLKKEVDKL